MAFNLDQSYEGSTDGNTGNGIGNLRRASNNQEILGQSFTPALAGPLNKIALYLKKEGAPTGNIWVEIHTDGADPTAAAQLGADSAVVDVSTVSGAGYVWVEFTFTVPIQLTPGVEYWILLYGDYALANDVGVYWSTDGSSPGYAAGIGGIYGNGSAVWEDQAGIDRNFRQYSDDAPPGGYFHMSA